jgi:hypothetical protein
MRIRGTFVIPAKAGTQPLLITAFALGSRFRGNGGKAPGGPGSCQERSDPRVKPVGMRGNPHHGAQRMGIASLRSQ